MNRKSPGRQPARRTGTVTMEFVGGAEVDVPEDIANILVDAANRPPETVDLDLSENARIIAECAVALRLAMGKPHDVIRREVIEVAKEAITGAMEDLGRGEWELEKYVAVVQRTIETELEKAA